MPRHDSESLALRWVPGTGPVQIDPIATGWVNESFHVERSGRRYVMRLVRGSTVGSVLDRQWECKVLACAERAGLGPVIARCDAASGVLVSRWRGCRPWTAEEAVQPGNMQAMSRLLHRVHALAIPQPARIMHPADWIAHYHGALAAHSREFSRRSRKLQLQASARLSMLGTDGSEMRSLCHSDLHRCNAVVTLESSPQLVLLDWEYAHVADTYWDLAGWAANNDWTGTTSQAWLQNYLEREETAAEFARLCLWMWLYDFVCILWCELFLIDAGPSAAREVEERLDLLCERCSSTPV